MKSKIEEIKGIECSYTVFTVLCDSMDNGLRTSFERGDRVFTVPVSIDELKEDHRGFWLIKTDCSVLFKQITGYDKDSDTFIFHSLNPLFKDILMDAAKIEKAYRVVRKKGRSVTYSSFEDV